MIQHPLQSVSLPPTTSSSGNVEQSPPSTVFVLKDLRLLSSWSSKKVSDTALEVILVWDYSCCCYYYYFTV